MNWQRSAFPFAAAAALIVPVGAHAKVYLSVEQAQHAMFGDAAMTQAPVVLTDDQQDKLHDASSVSLKFDGHRIWKVAGGGWFVVDQVVGKHEMITYAVGIDAAGKVKDVEILEYLESYGYEVADESWRRQFVGKTADAPLKLNKDITNISGATLSSKHITDGVKRVMTMYDLALKLPRDVAPSAAIARCRPAIGTFVEISAMPDAGVDVAAAIDAAFTADRACRAADVVPRSGERAVGDQSRRACAAGARRPVDVRRARGGARPVRPQRRPLRLHGRVRC